MTGDDLTDILRDQENQLLQNFLLPTELIIDLRIVDLIFGRTDIKQYKLPVMGYIVPVKPGKTDQILLMGTKEGL